MVCSDVFIFLGSKFKLVLKPVITVCTTHFNIPKLCILPAECICVFRRVLTINSINRLRFVAEMQ
jgi:hypothetical protein